MMRCAWFPKQGLPIGQVGQSFASSFGGTSTPLCHMPVDVKFHYHGSLFSFGPVSHTVEHFKSNYSIICNDSTRHKSTL